MHKVCFGQNFLLFEKNRISNLYVVVGINSHAIVYRKIKYKSPLIHLYETIGEMDLK